LQTVGFTSDSTLKIPLILAMTFELRRLTIDNDVTASLNK
jgi:hypothetical protein